MNSRRRLNRMDWASVESSRKRTPLCAHEMAPGLAMRWPPPTMLATRCGMVGVAVGRSGDELVGGRYQVVCVNTSMEVSTDDGCRGIRTWDVGGVRAGT